MAGTSPAMTLFARRKHSEMKSAQQDAVHQGEDHMSIRKHRTPSPPLEPVAGNGLLDRRALLRGGAMVAGAMTTGVSVTGAAAEPPLQNDPWSLEMGAVVPAYQVPSRVEKDVVRTRRHPNNEI